MTLVDLLSNAIVRKSKQCYLRNHRKARRICRQDGVLFSSSDCISLEISLEETRKTENVAKYAEGCLYIT